MLKWLDVALLLLLGTYLIVLSVILLKRLFRGERTGVDQLSLLPDSWKRWMLSEKPKHK